MKRFFTILCLCSLLFAFTGCSGTAPVATEASTVTEATAESTTEVTTTTESTTEVTTTAESTTEATASSTDVETKEPIKEIQYTVPMDRINMSILWFYKFTVDPSVCQVSFTSPENWIPGEVMSKVTESALYNLSDGSAALSLCFASDTEEWVHEIGGPNLYIAYDYCLEKQTEDGRQYLLYKKDMPAYHATSYLCYLELHSSDQKYVFVFRAWADSDDTELIEKMISSIRLVEK